MPIVIARVPDPTSPSWEQGSVDLAQSESGQILTRSITRYLKGEISGRSVLVAGHRGAGKTTLVDLALRNAETADSRPLRVSLYGPSLFPHERQEAPAANPNEAGETDARSGKQKARSSRTEASEGRDAPPSDAQRLLMELTVALYRSLAKEVVASFERTLASLDPATLPSRHAEIPSQLILELDEAPGPDRLRRFWEALRRSRQGVLFPDAPNRRPDQGMRELVALASAAQAFRVVAGKIDHSEESSRKVEQTNANSAETKVDVKAILGAILTLVSGLFGAAAVLLTGQAAAMQIGSPSLGWFGAALAAVLAAYTAKRTAKATMSRKTVQARSYKFIRDYKVDTLARELPNLIERVRQAGIAPVFVVDELDKLPDLPNKLHELIRELKPLVAERTFFCFISDRSYYEYIRMQARDVPYSPEHTYFTHRLYLVYWPEGLREFLTRAVLAEPETDENHETLDLERRALTYVMLFRARFHPFELSRQIQNFAAGSGQRHLLEWGAVRTDAGSLYAIAYQLAVEAILRQEELTSRMVHDAYFRQLVYDALYSPAEAWQDGKEAFELSKDALRANLASRMNRAMPDVRDPWSREGETPQGHDVSQKLPCGEAVDHLLSASDLDFLLARVEELVDYLARPRTLQSDIAWLGMDVDVARLVPGDPLLAREDSKVQFSYDVFGRPLAGLADTQREKLVRVGPQLRDLDRRLRFTTMKSGTTVGLAALADEYRLLETSPAWQTVVVALDGFARSNFERLPKEAAKDALAAIRYGDGIQERSLAIALAFACARRLMRLSGADCAACLSALSRLGGLVGQGTGGIESALRDISRSLDVQVPDLSPDMRLDTLAELLSPVEAPSLTPEEIRGARAALWEQVFNRIRSTYPRVTNLWRPKRSELVCLALKASPISVLRSDLSEMTVAEWTTVLRLASERLPVDHLSHVPSWMGLVAAEYLGLRRAGLPPRQPTATAGSTREADIGRNLTALFAGTAAEPVPEYLLVVIAQPASKAMRWHIGQRVVALVTNSDEIMNTISAMSMAQKDFDRKFANVKRLVLFETPNLGIPIDVLGIFEHAPIRHLSWAAAKTSRAPREPIVYGTLEMDDLWLVDADEAGKLISDTGAPD